MNDPSVSTILSVMQDELRATLALVAESEAVALEEALLAAPRVFCAARGRSELVLRAFAMRLMHLGLTVHLAGDTTTPAITQGDLLLLVSGTAATSSLQPLAAHADALRARRAVVTATPNGVLARGADPLVVVSAPPSHLNPGSEGASWLPMGSRFEFASALLFEATTVRLLQRLGVSVKEMFARHANLE